MNKLDFFQLLNENRYELAVSKSSVDFIDRGTSGEVVLKIQSHAMFTLSRHKPQSRASVMSEMKFSRWLDEWRESDANSELTMKESSEQNMMASPVEAELVEFVDVEFSETEWSVPVVASNLPQILNVDFVRGFTGRVDWICFLFGQIREGHYRARTTDEKKPDSHPAKVTQQFKDKEYPQTPTQYLNVNRSVFASAHYHLSNTSGLHKVSDSITRIFLWFPAMRFQHLRI